MAKHKPLYNRFHCNFAYHCVECRRVAYELLINRKTFRKFKAHYRLWDLEYALLRRKLDGKEFSVRATGGGE